MVWEKTAEIYKDIVHSEGWANRDVVETPVIQDVTFKVSLVVLIHTFALLTILFAARFAGACQLRLRFPLLVELATHHCQRGDVCT